MTLCLSILIVTPTIEVSSTANPDPVLKCTVVGLPAVITWGYSSSSRVYVTDENHKIYQTLVNRDTSTLESKLHFVRHPYLVDAGERVCTATSIFVSTNSSETNTTTIIGTYI